MPKSCLPILLPGSYSESPDPPPKRETTWQACNNYPAPQAKPKNIGVPEV